MLGKFNADFAAWSAFSLPVIPMWLGWYLAECTGGTEWHCGWDGVTLWVGCCRVVLTALVKPPWQFLFQFTINSSVQLQQSASDESSTNYTNITLSYCGSKCDYFHTLLCVISWRTFSLHYTLHRALRLLLLSAWDGLYCTSRVWKAGSEAFA